MVPVSQWTGEKEVVFPEVAALAIGLWIIDKRVWQVRRRQIVPLMTIGAIAGVCIVRYSPFPLPANLCMAFAFAGLCLSVSRTTLIPLISACMLPVTLHTETWVYPAAVFFLSLAIVSGQLLMERAGVRDRITDAGVTDKRGKTVVSWLLLLCFTGLATILAAGISWPYMILPPLIVTFTEMATSKAGFRNRPIQVFFFLVTAATLGVVSQVAGHALHLPGSIVALFIFGCLLLLFEWSGKYFVPAGALGLIPLLLPSENLAWVPLQVAAGAGLFISIAMIAFQRCYKWNRAQLLFCLAPAPHIHRKKR